MYKVIIINNQNQIFNDCMKTMMNQLPMNHS